MGKAKAILFSVGIFLWMSSLSQQFLFVHYTPKDGLINSRVRKAYQDSKGRMYFTSFGGLSVYDGARFRNYTTQNGLSADLVNDVLEVKEDSLLVATNSTALNVLVNGQMRTLTLTNKYCPVINQFVKSQDGSIYASTDDGLHRLQGNTLTKLIAQLPGTNIDITFLGAMIEYNDFLVFTTNDLSDHHGLFLYDKKKKIITDRIPDLYVYNIQVRKDAVVWVSTNSATMILDSLSIRKGKLKLLHPKTHLKENFPGGTFSFNSENEILISADHKITHYRNDGTVTSITGPELSAFSVQSFFIDREDVIWICNDGNGVFKLANTRQRSILSTLSPNRSGIRTVTGFEKDAWWIVMNDGELIFATNNSSKSYKTTPVLSPYLLHNTNKGIYAADKRTLFKASIPKENSNTLAFQKILTLADTSAFGGVAVTDKFENTILYETEKLLVLKDDQVIFTYPMKPFDLVQGLHIDDDNRLWALTRYNGLMIFSIHVDTPSAYLKKEFQSEGFSTGSPRSLVIDAYKMIWIGTRFEGLMGFSFENNQLKKIYHFRTHSGLTDNFITSLACDGKNNIIVGTQTGLDRLIRIPGGYRIENVTKRNNIFTYINIVWTDGRDYAYAWTNTSEILRAEPVSVEKKYAQPRLLLEGIRVNGKVLDHHQTNLQLSHSQRNITFSVAAPTFMDESQVKYSYLLSGGGNEKWSDTSDKADISLLNLSPGEYNLQVEAFFPSTPYASEKTQFSFSILPPWWQTWWFRILAGTLLLSMIILIIRSYFRRKLEKQKLFLEKQQAIEKERTRIASDMHDDLGAGLSTIRFLSEKVKRNTFSEVTKADSERIVANSNELMQKMNEIIWAMNEKNDSLEDLLFYTRSYAVEYCTENALVCETQLPSSIPDIFVSGEIRRNVFLVVKESLHNIVKHAHAQKVYIDFSIDNKLKVTIRDDGIGMNGNIRSTGNGLRNMEKRIRSVNGDFQLSNEAGVTISVAVPLAL